MRTKYASLSGSNRLTRVQAIAIRDLNESYEYRFSVEVNSQISILTSALAKIRNSIHRGRLADMSKHNRLSFDEVAALKEHLVMILRTRTYNNGFQKNAIKAAIVKLTKTDRGRKELSGGRNRWHPLVNSPDDAWECEWEDEIQPEEPDSSGSDMNNNDDEHSDDDTPF
jgi:hypothetical protein